MPWSGKDLAKVRMAKMDTRARAKVKTKERARTFNGMVPTRARAKAKILPKENQILVVAVAKAMSITEA